MSNFQVYTKYFIVITSPDGQVWRQELQVAPTELYNVIKQNPNSRITREITRIETIIETIYPIGISETK